jgi:hypothetical protein
MTFINVKIFKIFKMGVIGKPISVLHFRTSFNQKW